QQNQSLIKGLQKGIRERATKRLFKGEVIKVEAHPIPEHPRPRRVVGRMALVGDAAGYVTKSSGEGIMSHSFFEYRPMQGDFDNRRNGVLIAFEEGTATFYALKNAEDRGQFFITPGTKVYKGMIIGENTRQQDMEINICKAKQVTNIRSAGADVLDTLQSPIQMTLERALEYIGPDEMLEVTPESMRLRKLPAKKMAKR
ncbi:hypothetical protein N8506_02445, partial [Synechococcus sp. AH-601-N23]|nr:hypothetical protein [Synechococcus sp. AH-601-N23]